jgi:predicted membrane-bound spermidine synthase
MQQSIIDPTANKPYARKERLYFLFVAFAIGMTITAIEKTITRLLIPYVGSTLYTDIGLGSALMLSLAAGYYIGSNKTEQYANPKLLWKILLGIGTYISLLALWAAAGARLMASGITIHPLRTFLTSSITSLLLIGLPLILVGMIIPYLIQLSTNQQPEKIGSVIGKIIAWVTLGSIGGGALSTFLALPFLGTQKTIFYIGCSLLIVALIGFSTVRLQYHHPVSK